MIDVHHFNAPRDGAHLLVLGAVHGNEPCGTVAINRLMSAIRSGDIPLTHGRLTLAPVCNPRAYAAGLRQTDVNLNRVIARHAAPRLYEHHLAHEIIGLINAADMVLDLHSYSCGTKPFVFLDHDTPAHRAFAAALGVADWVTGWNDAYAANAGLNAGDTVSYAVAAGKTALLLECGQHADPQAAENAYDALRRALAHAGLCLSGTTPPPVTPRITRMRDIVTKKKDGKWTKSWQHLDPVARGDTVAVYDDGETVNAPYDGVMLLPSPNAATGEEWMYFGSPA